MKNYSAFDILGPIMIGPSSSHTAGAARLGKIAATIAAGEIVEVKCYAHGTNGAYYVVPCATITGGHTVTMMMSVGSANINFIFRDGIKCSLLYY